jgi:hypothetical protein
MFGILLLLFYVLELIIVQRLILTIRFHQLWIYII